ncbi:hypothetical protein CAPTEDRAFT_196580, partial [Capitella teleta]
MEELDADLQTNFLLEAGQIYHALNPPMARYVMNLGLKQGCDRFAKDFTQKKVCKFCGAFLSPQSSSVRFPPKAKRTKRLQNLAAKVDGGAALSKYEHFLASQHLQGNKQILTCKICKRKEKYLCVLRRKPSKGTTDAAESTSIKSSHQETSKKKKKKKKKNKQVNSAEILLSE